MNRVLKVLSRVKRTGKAIEDIQKKTQWGTFSWWGNELRWKAVLVYPHFLSTNDFATEKEMGAYIELNIDVFCRDALKAEYISHNAEFYICDKDEWGPNRKRADLFIKCKDSDYIVELKSPYYRSENRTGIGQLLDYGRYKKDAKLVLVTSMFDLDTQLTIDEYDLPITYIYLDRSIHCQYHDCNRISREAQDRKAITV